MGEKCHNREQGHDDCEDDVVSEETAHDSRNLGFGGMIVGSMEK